MKTGSYQKNSKRSPNAPLGVEKVVLKRRNALNEIVAEVKELRADRNSGTGKLLHPLCATDGQYILFIGQNEKQEIEAVESGTTVSENDTSKEATAWRNWHANISMKKCYKRAESCKEQVGTNVGAALQQENLKNAYHKSITEAEVSMRSAQNEPDKSEQHKKEAQKHYKLAMQKRPDLIAQRYMTETDEPPETYIKMAKELERIATAMILPPQRSETTTIEQAAARQNAIEKTAITETWFKAAAIFYKKAAQQLPEADAPVTGEEQTQAQTPQAQVTEPEISISDLIK